MSFGDEIKRRAQEKADEEAREQAEFKATAEKSAALLKAIEPQIEQFAKEAGRAISVSVGETVMGGIKVSLRSKGSVFYQPFRTYEVNAYGGYSYNVAIEDDYGNDRREIMQTAQQVMEYFVAGAADLVAKKGQYNRRFPAWYHTVGKLCGWLVGLACAGLGLATGKVWIGIPIGFAMYWITRAIWPLMLLGAIWLGIHQS